MKSYATIILKSGTQFDIDVRSITTRRSGSNELVSMEWETPPGATRRLSSITLDDVSAVLFHPGDEPWPTDEETS